LGVDVEVEVLADEGELVRPHDVGDAAELDVDHAVAGRGLAKRPNPGQVVEVGLQIPSEPELDARDSEHVFTTWRCS